MSQGMAHTSFASSQRRLVDLINQPLRFTRQEDFGKDRKPVLLN